MQEKEYVHVNNIMFACRGKRIVMKLNPAPNLFFFIFNDVNFWYCLILILKSILE